MWTKRPEAATAGRMAVPGFWLRVAWLWQEPLPPLLEVLREEIRAGKVTKDSLARRLERQGGGRAIPLRALSETEAVLLERMQRLMAMVTAAPVSNGSRM